MYKWTQIQLLPTKIAIFSGVRISKAFLQGNESVCQNRDLKVFETLHKWQQSAAFD